MDRWRMRGAAVLAVIALAVAGCDTQQADPTVDDLTSPAMTDMMTDEASPATDGATTSPDESPSPTSS